jgi:hypothetical protein
MGRRLWKETSIKPDEVRTTITLPAEMWRRVRHRAADEHTDLRSVVEAALALYLKTPVKAR